MQPNEKLATQTKEEIDEIHKKYYIMRDAYYLRQEEEDKIFYSAKAINDYNYNRWKASQNKKIT